MFVYTFLGSFEFVPTLVEQGTFGLSGGGGPVKFLNNMREKYTRLGSV